MPKISIPRCTRRTLTLGAVIAAAATTAVAVPATASPTHGAQAAHTAHAAHHRQAAQRPVRAHTNYLALGDSVSFGYREPANTPPPNYAKASSFVGFPEDVARELGLHVANASCPGETSASLINSKKQSYACETDSTGTGPGYRTAFPLHVHYSGSQLAYGVHYLRTHRNTRLVTLMIGANDAFLCQSTTSDKCASELPGVLKRIRRNVATILRTLRHAAHYRGQIVIVDYYSTDYTSATQRASSKALNAAMNSGARRYHVRIANGYATFRKAAAQTSGDTCKAGLLTFLTTGGCGVHPSAGGQSLLAGTVEHAVRK